MEGSVGGEKVRLEGSIRGSFEAGDPDLSKKTKLNGGQPARVFRLAGRETGRLQWEANEAGPARGLSQKQPKREVGSTQPS